MVNFKYACRQCFCERGHVILMNEKEGEIVCPVNPEHKWKEDVMFA